MNRRRFLQAGAALPLLPDSWPRWPRPVPAAAAGSSLIPRPARRPGMAVRGELGPTQPGGRWPADHGAIAARGVPRGAESATCAQVFDALKNPYYLGDEVGLTQTLGWVDAWTSRPSVYAVAARTTDDVVAAVNFARENNLRLVVKGGGHSYQGTSNAADSLLIWTRRDERHHRARRVRRRRMRGASRAAAGRHGGGRGDLGAGLRRRHDEGGPLRPGGRLPDGGRGGAHPERRLRQLSRRPTGWRRRACSKPRSSRPMARCGSPMPARIRTYSGRSRGAVAGASVS